MMGFDHFSLLAPFYDRLFQTGGIERLVCFTHLPAAGRLLDVGGGTGRISAGLRGYVDSTTVLDVSYDMLQQARHKKDLHVVCGESEVMPFADGHFTRIIMVDALHHVRDHKLTANELWRVLAPGGILVILEPDILKFPVKLLALFEKLALMRSHFLNANQMVHLFSSNSRRIQVKTISYNVYLIAEKPGMSLADSR